MKPASKTFERSRWIQLFRGMSLLWPSAFAWHVVTHASQELPLDHVVTWSLGTLWLATLTAIVARVVDATISRRGARAMAWIDAADLLTASGSSMAWFGAGALILSSWLGWASLSVVGLLSLGVLHLVALWTLLRTGGSDPWRRTSLSRTFTPARVVEGSEVKEQLCFRSPRIPAGFRLFAKGRVGQRWPLSRYMVESADSDGEVRLERDVGPAHRGEHDSEPLVVWLQDVLGLCHSAFAHAGGGARLTVLPEPKRVVGVTRVLGQGGDDKEPLATRRRPTEGSLQLREYQTGDDARRIHWLRSLTRGELVVRLPDELPPDEPDVRLVLDTFFPGLEKDDTEAPDALTCDAPDVLLDALVRVWLGTGRALVDAGVRVTLVAGVAHGERLCPVSEPLFPRAISSAQRLGARARWQETLPPSSLLSEDRTIVVSHRLPRTPEEAAFRWIVVPAELWSPIPERPQQPTFGLLPYAIGSADNRQSRRAADRARRERSRGDHAAFGVLAAHSLENRAGNLVARARPTGAVELEVLS
jgi:uncharacterized protein (DUF58 family)